MHVYYSLPSTSPFGMCYILIQGFFIDSTGFFSERIEEMLVGAVES